MTTRGVDQGARKQRGAPSDKTKQRRGIALKAKKSLDAQAGHRALFNLPEVVPPLSAAAASSSSSSSSCPSSSAATEDEVAFNNLSHPAESVTERRDAPHQPDLYAELDDDEQLKDGELHGGVMQSYLEAINNRLRAEINGSKLPAVINLLKGNEWILRCAQAERVCSVVELQYTEPSYYKDVYVWLPDIRWGIAAMPPCPTCASNAQVGFHCWRDNHFGRRIVSLDTHYFVLSRRYLCHCCQGISRSLKKTAEDMAKASGLVIEAVPEDKVTTAYTFMAWDALSLPHLPFGYGSEFPAFLTHRSGVDMKVVDLMRSLFDKGVRPEALSNTMLELHTKKYTKDYLKREHELARDRQRPLSKPPDPGMFSTFSDKKLYGGLVPTGHWLATVYKKYHASIEDHLNREVKKRGCERLHWDASYKEAKHLARYHGKGIFKALITGTNERGEIRVQFHVVTDGHDQFMAPIMALRETLNAYGHVHPQLFVTDQPSVDKEFFLKAFPSLQTKQDQLDSLVSAPPVPAAAPAEVNIDSFSMISGIPNINNAVASMHELLNKAVVTRRVVALDCEWDTGQTARGFVVQSYPVSLIQLGYFEEDGIGPRALLLRVHGLKKLPSAVLKLFQDTKVTFVGRSVSGDINKIGRDLQCADVTINVRTIELDSMAKQRGMVKGRSNTLQQLAETILGVRLDKDPMTRLSKWSAHTLTASQQMYAALDALVSLRIYDTLMDMPDLTKRLTDADDFVEGTMVDVVPSHGSLVTMATRAATAKIITSRAYNPQVRFEQKTQRQQQSWKLVEVSFVYASHYVVPGLRHSATSGTSKTTKVTMEDLGPPPFDILLPLKVLAPHYRDAGGKGHDIGARPMDFNDSSVGDNNTSSTSSSSSGTTSSISNGSSSTSTSCSSSSNNGSSIIGSSSGTSTTSNNSSGRSSTTSSSTSGSSSSGSTCSGSSSSSTSTTSTDTTSTTGPNNGSNSIAEDYDENDLDSGPTTEEEWMRLAEDSVLTTNDVSFLNAAVAAMTSTEALDVPELGPVHTNITDKFSSVNGDSFHYMDRCKVPTHHSYKKGFYVALRTAWFMFNPGIYNELVQALKADGLSQLDIDHKLYYDFQYFRRRVPRLVPPPSLQYRRVRAVYALYGKCICEKSGKPLFNAQAWCRAKNVLLEILDGNAADPPGMQFYYQALDAKGNPAMDEHGFPLLDCNRGTNDVENSHKAIVTVFGTWNTGVWMSDCLLGERRHRHNQNISEHRRTGFPRFGHYDTWLIDLLQLLVEQNHNVHLHPSWPNTADYSDTKERFGTVAIHSDELREALKMIKISPDVKFTSDQQYLCDRMGTPAPLLPVHGEKEYALFGRLLRSSDFDGHFEKMAIDWCRHVDGKDIFPKLPVYLRTHHNTYQHNQLVRAAVQSAATGEEVLTRINNETLQRALDPTATASLSHPPNPSTFLPPLPPPPSPSAPILPPLSAVAVSASVRPSNTVAASTRELEGDRKEAQCISTTYTPFRPVIHHPGLTPATNPRSDDHIIVVGGVAVVSQQSKEETKRSQGQRSKDIQPRAKRTCQTCKLNGREEQSKTCKGRSGRSTCEHTLPPPI